MKQYLQLCQTILDEGIQKSDRTGTGTKSIFGHQMRFKLKDGFPLMTTKRVSFKLIATELLWFLSGATNIQWLVQQNNHIWDDWPFAVYKESSEYQGETMAEFAEKIKNDDYFALRWGDLGSVYGKQWRRWETPYYDSQIAFDDPYDDGLRIAEIDQIANVIEQIKNNPDSRRILVVAYNPGEVDKMALPPCHSLFQFYVADGKLSCQLYQRSGDTFLGIPYNIASYSLLVHMIAHVCDLEVGDFIHSIGDAHIYNNHFDQVNLQLSRETRQLPQLRIKRKVDSIFDFKYEDFELVGYDPHPSIKGEVSV